MLSHHAPAPRRHRLSLRTTVLSASRRPLMAGVLLVTAALVVALATSPSLGSYSARVTNPTNSAASAVWAPPTCLDQAQTDAAYLFWRLDEASGTAAADATGNGFPGTYVTPGVTYRSTPGPCLNDTQSRVATFDGSRGYLYGPRFGTAPTTLSEEIWFKTTTTTGGKLIGLGNRQTGASTAYDRHLYMSNDGRLFWGTQAGSTYQTVASTATYRDGQWHHAVATMSPSGANKGLTLYVDGKVVASNDTYTSALTTANLYIRVGYDTLSNNWPSSPTSDYFKGSLADVALYPSAVTPEQVKAHYDAGS